MNTPLKLFTDPTTLTRLQRPLLTRFLEDNQAALPPDAAALLKTSLNGLTFEEYCSAWATQFCDAIAPRYWPGVRPNSTKFE